MLNTAHPLIEKLLADEEAACSAGVQPIATELTAAEAKNAEISERNKGKKDEEIPTADKSEQEDLQKKIDELRNKKKDVYKAFATDNQQVRQLIDLALLANNMLKGEALAKFVKRSVELM